MIYNYLLCSDLICLGDQIKNDLKRMGTTLNWDNEYFTMDEVILP